MNFQIWPRAIVGAGSFWNYQSKLTPDSEEFAMMIDTQHKVSRHFRFIVVTLPSLKLATGKVTAKLKEIKRTFCTPFNRQRAPVWDHAPFTTRDVISLTVIVQPCFQCSLSCSERQSFFLEARESTLGTRLVNFHTTCAGGQNL